jgi:SH3-like domain-containing protein
MLSFGQDAPVNPDEGNSKFQFEGVINANSVYVHSGPNDNDYPTMKLDRGTHVTVVGIRFDWLKIIPPDGSFCYVAKAYTEKRGDGSVGRTTNALNVHVGSDLNTLKVKVALRLDAGTDVQIIGEQDEYFKIKPPEGVYVYVDKQFVDPVKQIALVPAPDAPSTPPPAGPSDGNTAPPNPDQAGATAPPTTAPDGMTVAPTTAPTFAAAPATQPADAVAAAQTEFDHLEATFATESGKPLEDQDPATLSAGYDKLAKGGLLPDSMLKIAQYKAATLKARADDRDEYLAVKKEQAEMNAKVAALRAERDELETRVKQSEIKAYTAVGTLRASSLQQGQQTLYRLTDPASGRTVIYIRTNDTKIGELMNQFIGVRGTATDDAQLSLRVIDPTNFEPVDPTKLYTSVMAEIVPPSLMPTGPQASSGN